MMRQKGFWECPNCKASLNGVDYRRVMEIYTEAVCDCCGVDMKDWVWVSG